MVASHCGSYSARFKVSVLCLRVRVCEFGGEASDRAIDEDASAVLLVPPRESRDRKILLLERLSYMLVETIATVGQKQVRLYLTKYALDSFRLKQHSLQIPILTIFTQLSLSSPDALSILVQSQALIPALVANLCNYSARAWEDDEDLYDEPALLM
jgi:hypothetical protein